MPHADWVGFQWLESVRCDASLTPLARLLAHELALSVWASETGQRNPDPEALARCLGVSGKMIRRALAELCRARHVRCAGGKIGVPW